MALFTVIIPTRNRPAFLREAVISVLRQESSDFELIIVNDGDGSVADFADRRIRIINNHQRGAVVGRNAGVAAAGGRFIAFLDDDDVWTRADHLGLAAQVLHHDAPFYFCDGMMVYPDGRRKVFARDANSETLSHDNTILISSVCYHKTLHNGLGLFDEALPYYWDWDWYLRVARSGATLQRCAEAVVDIRVHPENMSGKNNEAARQANLDLLCHKHGMLNVELKAHTDFV